MPVFVRWGDGSSDAQATTCHLECSHRLKLKSKDLAAVTRAVGPLERAPHLTDRRSVRRSLDKQQRTCPGCKGTLESTYHPSGVLRHKGDPSCAWWFSNVDRSFPHFPNLGNRK
jgi:hypothetical protein